MVTVLPPLSYHIIPRLQDCEDEQSETIVKLHLLLTFLADATSVKDVRYGLWNGACKREQSHQAQVIVIYTTNTVTKVRHMCRTTFTEQMANLGMDGFTLSRTQDR